MKPLLYLLCAAVILSASARAQVSYYVDSLGGNDANAGSISAPWKTLAKVNNFISGTASLANTQIFLKRGDVWHEQLQCISNLSSASGWTTTAHPPMCSGSPNSQFTISAYGVGANPLIDGADMLTLAWTLVTGTTYKATITGQMPCKLYVDGSTSETKALTPVPNATGAYSATKVYSQYDGVVIGTDFYIRGCVPPSSGVAPSSSTASTWLDNTNPYSGNTSQAFSTVNSGVQNVQSTPGSWYGTGNTIYVNLADGSDPNGHTFEGSVRKYGILLQSANYATIQSLTIEHTIFSAIASVVWSNDNGTYFTNEYNRFLSNTAYNYGTITVDALANQSGHPYRPVAGIMVSAGLQYNPHLLRGIIVSGNTIGRSDSYFGQQWGYFAPYNAGIVVAGSDGGGTANNAVINGNTVTAINVACIHYDTTGLYATTGVMLNNGGTVSSNTCTNSQGNIYFTATVGGTVTQNTVVNSYGEGIQLGGQSTSTATQPQVISYNVIAHLGMGASTQIYNGIDCNSQGTSVSGIHIDHNTIVNTNSASVTFEGCAGEVVTNNIFDQNAPRWPQGDIINPSYSMYFVNGIGNSGQTFSNNLWFRGTNSNPWHSSATQYGSCATFLSGWPDTSSLCGVDPLFTSVTGNNFTLQPGSPAIGAGTGGTNIGAK